MDIDFHKKRTTMIINNIDDVVRKAIKNKFIKVEPSRENILAALKIITDFISDKGRIIYGGLSQNEFIKLKNKDAVFYKEDSLDIPDYDIYSPEPLQDLIYLANALYDKGYHQVSIREAVHVGTYTLGLDRVNGNMLDMHYVWRPHYNNIAKKKIGKFYYADPEFMMIDMYKICTDPLLSFDFRIEKVFKRTSLLEQYYPINADKNKFNKRMYNDLSKQNKDIINKIIVDYVATDNDIIISGMFCYNFFIQQVNKNDVLNIDHLTLITDNIYKASDKILNLLIKLNIKDNITTKSYHPFFETFDKKIQIKYNDITVVEIYGNMGRCIPYVTVKNKSNVALNFISFHGLLLYFYGALFMYKYNKKYNKVEFIKNLIHNLHKTRNTYLKKNNLTGLETGIFAELIVDCKFKTQDARILDEQRVQQNIKKGKQPKYSYRPSKKRIDHTVQPPFIFSNTSGNHINSKN